MTDYILDVDTQFLANIERANKALKNSVEAANELTERFTRMVSSSGNYTQGVQNLLSVLSKLKGLRLDETTGTLKWDGEIRNTADAIELLGRRTEGVKARWRELTELIGPTKGNVRHRMRIVDEQQLTNVAALQKAIASINTTLNNKRAKPLSAELQAQLVEQRAIYQALLKEVQRTDTQRVQSEIDANNKIIADANRRSQAVIEAKRKEVNEAIQLAKSAKTSEELIRANKTLRTAKVGLESPQTTQEMIMLQRLNAALDTVYKKYEALTEVKTKTPKIKTNEAKEARDLAASAKSADELNRAYIALSKAKANINPDTKKGQIELQRLERALESVQKRMDILNNSTPTGALVFAGSAKSLEELNQAKTYLQNAMQGVVDPTVMRSLNDAFDQVLQKIKEIRSTSAAGDTERTRKNADEQYKYAMALARSAKSSSELSAALSEVRRAQLLFNSSTGDGMTRISALRREENKLNDAIARQRGELTATQKKNIENAISFAKQAQGATQLTLAYGMLKSAARGINPNTDEGRKAFRQLASEIDAVKQKLKEASNNSQEIKQKVSSIGPAIKTAFSLGMITRFVSNLVKVHGEFEKINVSLKVLVSSSARAEVLWDRITKLALKSPFTVTQLATATKQMAAYRIEADKLYSSTKMLADISAGLGVEISRLILAYGQVKAANFLRGTELRQFSEAGIDMLGQLAAYYSELEKKTVTAAEVFERISKRMVLFEDVDAVLRRVTSRGGAFYEMQETQSRTLAGQLSNLKDQIQLMLHDIGTSTHGIIVTVIKMTRWLIEHWRGWLPLLAGIASGFLTIKAAGIALAVLKPVFASITAVIKLTTAATRSLSLAFRLLQATPLGWIGTLAAALVTLGVTIGGYIGIVSDAADASDDFADGASEVGKILKEESDEIGRLGKSIIGITEYINDLREEQEKLNETDDSYVTNSNLIDEAISRRSVLVAELATKNAELAGNIGAVIDKEIELRELLFGEKVRKAELSEVANTMDIPEEVFKRYDDKMRAFLGNYRRLVNSNWTKKFTQAYDDGGVGGLEETLRNYIGDFEETKALELEVKRRAADLSSLRDGDSRRIVESRINELNSRIDSLDAQNEKLYNAAKDVIAARMEFDEYIASAGKKYMEQQGWKEGMSFSPDEKEQIVRDFEEIISAADKTFEEVAILRRGLSDFFGFKWLTPEPVLLPWQDRYNDYIEAGKEAVNAGAEEMASMDNAFKKITNSQTSADSIVERLDEKIKYDKEVIKAWNSYTEEEKLEGGKLRYSEADFQESVAELPIAEYLRKFFPAEEKKTTKRESPITDIISGIKEVHNAYKELDKTTNKVTATQGAWEKYGNMLKEALGKAGISIDQFKAKVGDLTSEESVIAAFDELLSTTVDKDDRVALEKARGEFKWELFVELDNKSFNDAQAKVQELMEGYEIGVELDKLHVPKDFAQNFFDVEISDLPELRLKVMAEYEGLNIGTEEQKKIDETLRKIDEMEAKAQQDRLKKYIEYTRDAMSERAEIMLKSFYEFQEIEEAFQLTNTMALNKGLIDENIKRGLDSAGKSIADLLELSDAEIMDDWFITEDQLALLREFNAELQRQRDLAKEGANQKTKTELDKEAWEQFQTTDTFQMLMSDLENMSEAAIGKMIEQLEKYKEQWKDMPVSDIKQLVDTIEKLKDAQAAFKTPRELKRVLEGYLTEGVNIQDEETGTTTATYKFDSVTDAQNQLVDSELRIQALEEELALVEQIEALRAQGASDAEILNQLKSQGLHSEEAISNAIGKSSKELKTNIKEENNRKTAASKVVGVTEDIQASYKEQAERIKAVQDLTNSLFDGWDAINSLFEDDSMSAALASMSGSILDSVLNCLALQANLKASTVEANTFGAAMNAAMGVIGWIVMGIQAITAILKFAFDQHDKNLQEQIDAQQEKVDKLQVAYEALEKQIEKAYTAANLGDLTRKTEENLRKQIDATEKMIALEEDKKKTDEDAIKSWENNIRDMRESIESLHEDAFSTLTDGILDDVLDTTRGFVDAWHDAYEETGDGMKGLEENFTEMLRNMLRQQASMQLISPFIDKYKEWLSQYVNEVDPTLTSEEARAWAERVKDTFPELNELLKGFFEGTQGLLETEGGLSGLEKGIQGMTEDQAEVLAAYWNSCRFTLTNIDNTLTKLANATLGADDTANPIVNAIKQQTEIVRTIKDMLSGVIGEGGGIHTGSYLKVYMP